MKFFNTEGPMQSDIHFRSAKYKEIITGGSAFNIKAESLRLG